MRCLMPPMPDIQRYRLILHLLARPSEQAAYPPTPGNRNAAGVLGSRTAPSVRFSLRRFLPGLSGSKIGRPPAPMMMHCTAFASPSRVRATMTIAPVAPSACIWALVSALNGRLSGFGIHRTFGASTGSPRAFR